MVVRECFNLDNARSGQQEAINCIITRITAAEPYTTIVLPTRYGKSDVIRLAAIYLVENGLAATCVVLEPGIMLRNQVISNDDCEKMLKRYPGQISPVVSTLKDFRPSTVFGKRRQQVHLFGSTIQLIVQNIQLAEEWVRFEASRTKKPIVFFVDESQTGSEDNSWGEAIERLTKAGARCVLLTATPFRSDGKKIPGFEFEEFNAKEKNFYRTGKAEVATQSLVSRLPGVEKLIRLKPHCEVTFKRAWDEDVICQINKLQIGTDFRLNDSVTRLVDMTEAEVRTNLRRIVESEPFVQEGCRMLIQRLTQRRSFSRRCSAIIFCGNDQDIEDNKHAKMIQRILHEQDPSLRSVIVTNKPDDDNDDAQLKILDFKNGKYDIIIVKQMGSVGLDVPHLKVGLDLSSVRTEAMFLQRLMRPATIFDYVGPDGRPGRIRVCDFITPADCISERLFKELVEEQGGTMRVTEFSEPDYSYLIDNKPLIDRPHDLYRVENVAHHNTLDTLLNNTMAQAYEDESLHLLMQRFPELTSLYTDAGISERLSGLTLTLEPVQPTVMNLSDEIDKKRKALVGHVEELSKMIVRRSGTPLGDQYRQQVVEVRKRLWSDLKRKAHVRRTKLDEIQDLDALDGMIRMVEDWTKQLFEQAA